MIVKKTESIGKEKAIKYFDSKEWQAMSDIEIVKKQLYTKEICIPVDVFHAALENVLNRKVRTLEYANPVRIQVEFENLTNE